MKRKRARTEELRLLLSRAEMWLLDQLADIERVNRTELLRMLIREEGKVQGVWPPAPDEDLGGYDETDQSSMDQ